MITVDGQRFTQRPMVESDHAFVDTHWAKSALQESAVANNQKFAQIARFQFYAGFRPVLEYWMHHARITMLCDADDENVLFGFVAMLPARDWPVWTYVHTAFRERGLGSYLCGFDLRKLDEMDTRRTKKPALNLGKVA